jgi:hypothetical protein
MNVGMENLTPVAVGADTATYDDIHTRHFMFVPGKYLPLLIMQHMTPKEALLTMNVEAVSQNEQDALKPLIDWLRVVAVTQTAVDDTTTSLVACTFPRTHPIMEVEFGEKQRAMVERILPAWNSTNMAPGGGATQSTNRW